MISGLVVVGLSVRDLDRAVAFYQDLLGLTLLSQSGFEGEFFGRVLGVPSPKGRMAVMGFSAPCLELWEYAQPEPRSSAEQRSISELGISHFCLTTSCLDKEFERLRAAGVLFNSEPITGASKTLGPVKLVYGYDPEGNVFELLQIGEPGA